MQTDNETKAWRDHVLSVLAVGRQNAAIRYQNDLLICAALEQMVNLEAVGRLTEDRWREIGKQIQVLLPKENGHQGAAAEVSHARLQ